MRERRIRIQELEANPSRCLDEVRSGTTLLLTDGGHRVARLIPEPGASDSPAIAWSGRRLKKTKPKARLRGGGSMADIVRGEPQVKLLHVDTSALFKRYVEENDSDAVLARIDEAPAVGTVVITRVEVAAALAKAVREQRLDRNEAQEAEQEFLDDWADFTRIGVTDALAARAADLAWRHDLRGYDAAQLGAALAWQETTAETEDEIVFACFDIELRQAATAEALETWPE